MDSTLAIAFYVPTHNHLQQALSASHDQNGTSAELKRIGEEIMAARVAKIPYAVFDENTKTRSLDTCIEYAMSDSLDMKNIKWIHRNPLINQWPELTSDLNEDAELINQWPKTLKYKNRYLGRKVAIVSPIELREKKAYSKISAKKPLHVRMIHDHHRGCTIEISDVSQLSQPYDMFETKIDSNISLLCHSNEKTQPNVVTGLDITIPSHQRVMDGPLLVNPVPKGAISKRARAFCIDHHVTTIAIQGDNNTVSNELKLFANQFSNDQRKVLPDNYCVDFMQDRNGCWRVYDIYTMGSKNRFSNHCALALVFGLLELNHRYSHSAHYRDPVQPEFIEDSALRRA
ncbi:hypothetical protein AB6D11_06485 [Vibrio splendidus]